MMKKGDTILCSYSTSDGRPLSLTVGKKYKVIDYWPFDYVVRIVNDEGFERDYSVHRFITLVSCEIESVY